MNLTGAQKKTVLAAFLGWMLDAFDFFLLTFVIKDIAKEFGVEVSAVAYALFLTLAMRFVGAFIFGRIGDRWGRKPALMLDILCYSILGALAAFAPNLWTFPRAAGPLRHRDGRRMGPRQFAGDGIDPAAGARDWCRASCSAAIPAAFFWRRSPTACSTAGRSATTRSAGGRCSCSASCRPSSSCSSARQCRNRRLSRRRGIARSRISGRPSPSTRGLFSTWSS